MSDIKALLKDARLPEKTVELCLRGDLVAEYEAVEAEHGRAVETRRPTLDGGGEVTELAQRLDALRAQMAAANVTFRLRAMTRHAFRALVAENPPRKDDAGEVDERDKLIGMNGDTFFDALVKVSVVEPELDEDDWGQLDESLTDRQFDLLANTAWALNRRDVDIPFSYAGSKTPT